MIKCISDISRLFAISCAIAALAGAAVWAPPAGHAQSQADKNQRVTASADATPVRSVGPGRVAFAGTPEGRWLGFGERGGRMLVDGGGIVVLARGGDGRLTAVADTRGDMRPLPGLLAARPVKEGARNGLRYPSPDADDDGDGRVDEDRLDGIDNDNDGRIDEDFAAIGDEMVVAASETGHGDAAPSVGDGQPGGDRAVSLHQEYYGWSLAHLDGMVAMKVTVRNTGREPLDDVRVGAVIERTGRMDISTEDLDNGVDAFGLATPLTAKSMTISDADGPAVAAVFVSDRGSGETASWLTGELRAGSTLAAVVRAAERPDALVRPDRAQGPRREEVGSDAPGATAPSDRRSAYGVSPSRDRLEPGEELEVYIALVALDDAESAERSINDAYRTIEGDSGHRLMPPPMSITRRTLWGSYELRVPDNAAAGVTLTLSNPRARGIDPIEISRLQGIDLRGATRTDTPSGDVVFELTGDLPDEIRESKRVVLSGQTRAGHVFNAVLRPTSVADGPVSVEAAQRYWNVGGKLDETLLSSSPNPFRVATNITYEVPATLTDENGAEFQFDGVVDTSVKVYNVAGRLVSTLSEATLGPGSYDVQWNASNATGDGVASGVYYVKLQIGKRFITKRLIQLK